MSKIKFLFLAYFIGFLACSCSDKVAGTTEDENTLAQYSSSSSFDEISSSVAEVSSSSFGHIERSFNADSLIFDGGGWGAVYSCPDSVEASEALENSITLGRFISGRIEKLMATGLTQEQADSTAQAELFAALGIDAFLREKPFRLKLVSNLLNYIFGGTVYVDFYESVEKAFTETGSLSKEHYCNFDADADNIRDAYTEGVFPEHYLYESSLYRFMYCKLSLFVPLEMVRIVDAKCYDLPVCDSTNIGKTFKAKYNSDEKLITCKETGWGHATAIGRATFDVPCDKEGKYIFYGGGPVSLSFVCSLDSGWYVAETVDAETFDVPCDKHGELYTSPNDSARVYVCRKERFCRHNDNYFDKSPLPSGYYNDFYIEYDQQWVAPCMDEGWDYASILDIETSMEVCDSEGKTLQSPSDSNLYYICHDEKWTEFYNLPCDTDNKRVKVGYTDYICYDKTWRTTSEWHVEYPAEYYFNPEVNYGSFTDPRDNYVYHTVEFKGRTWIAESMKYAGFPDSVLAKETRCLADSCKNVGRYYSAKVANEVCPEGWNLPDSNDILAFATMNDAIKLISWLNGEPDIYGLSFILNGRIVDTDMPYSSWQGKLALLWMNETNEEIGRLVATITKSWDKTVKIWAGHQPDWYANMQWISLYPESDWAPTPDGFPEEFIDQTFLPVRCVKK